MGLEFCEETNVFVWKKCSFKDTNVRILDAVINFLIWSIAQMKTGGEESIQTGF